MEQIPVPRNESPEFLCPSCGASAFEVIAKQKDISRSGEAEEFLVLKCLICLEEYRHHLATPELTEHLLNA